MKHQERTERAAQAHGRHADQFWGAALWQIAHSLAAIADALEPPTRTFNLNFYGPPEDEE